MEENDFHYLENEFSLARIRSVFKEWFPHMSMTVLLVEKNSQVK